MAFNILEIKASLEKHAYLKSHSFDIQMGIPPIMKNSRLSVINQLGAKEIDVSLNDMKRIIRVRAEEASLPGAMILGSDNTRYGIGPSQKNPNNVLFTDMPVTFLADRFGMLWSFFYLWKQSIFTWDQVASKTNGQTATRPRYTLQYKKLKNGPDGGNYVTDIDITMYDVQNIPRMKFKLIDAYPNAVPSAPVAWNATDQLLKLHVNFTFQRFEMQDITEEKSDRNLLPTTTQEWTKMGENLHATTPITNFTA